MASRYVALNQKGHYIWWTSHLMLGEQEKVGAWVCASMTGVGARSGEGSKVLDLDEQFSSCVI